MPTNLLQEEPIAVKDDRQQAVTKATPAANRVQPLPCDIDGEHKPSRAEAWARKVFEGRPEFLGWTPD